MNLRTRKETQVTKPGPPVESRFPWQRITLSLIGIVIILFEWRWAVNHLYALSAQQAPVIVAFQSITNNSMYVIAALVVFFVTGRLVYEWKNATISNIVQEAQSTVTEDRTVAPKHFDDPAIP